MNLITKPLFLAVPLFAASVIFTKKKMEKSIKDRDKIIAFAKRKS